MDLVKVLSEQQLKSDLPTLKIGDTVKVHAKIKEGNRERIQVFEGIIIAKKHAGVNQTVTVRRISYGVGVEKTFPVQRRSDSQPNTETGSSDTLRFLYSPAYTALGFSCVYSPQPL